MAHPDIPLVLHIRGQGVVNKGDSAYVHCLDFLRGKVSPNQKIQLHSFGGSKKIVEAFLGVFPATFFSYGGLMKGFTNEQKEGLRSVPRKNLLFETDSPYLSLNGKRKNYPQFLSDIIQRTSDIRNCSLGNLIEAHKVNFLRCFQ